MSKRFYSGVPFFLFVIYSSMLSAAPPPSFYVDTGTITTEHFIIRWEKAVNQNQSSDEWIDKVGSYLEKAWNYQININNYDTPPGTPANKIIVDVWNLVDPATGDKYYGSTSWDSPPMIELENDYSGFFYSGETGLKITIAHEFFHAIQHEYYTKTDATTLNESRWLREGTAVFMEDQDYDGVIVDNINSYYEYAQNFLGYPETSLENHDPYSTVLFWMYLDQKYPGKIKDVLVNFKNNGNTSVLNAIGEALGDPAPDYFGDKFKTLFKDFTLACYMKDDATYGFKDDGASQLPDVAQVSPADITDDYYIDTFDEANQKIIPKERQLNHLAANYIPVNKPATLKEKTKIYIFTDGMSDTDWGFWAVKVLNDDTKEPEEITLDGTHKANKTYGTVYHKTPNFCDDKLVL